MKFTDVTGEKYGKMVCNRMKTDMGVDVLYEHLNKMLDNSNVWKRTA